MKTRFFICLLLISSIALSVFDPLSQSLIPSVFGQSSTTRFRCHDLTVYPNNRSETQSIGLPCWVLDPNNQLVPSYWEEDSDVYRIANGRIGIEVFKGNGFAKFWNPNFTEVRLYEEQWEVEWCCQGPNWRSTGLCCQNPTFTLIENSTGIYLEVLRSLMGTGSLTVTFMIKEGQPLKHTLRFCSSLPNREFRIIQKWSGIVADRIVNEFGNEEEISGSTIKQSGANNNFEFRKSDGSVSIVENQNSAGLLFGNVTIDTHAQGMKADFNFQNSDFMTIGNGGCITIDPDTFTSSAFTSKHANGNGSFCRDFSSSGSQPVRFGSIITDRCIRSVVVWVTTSIPDGSDVTNTVFEYDGNAKVGDPNLAEIRSMTMDDCTSVDETLYDNMDLGTQYVTSWTPAEIADSEIDLGTNADSDVELELTGGDSFCISFSMTGLDIAEGSTQYWDICNIPADNCSPDPTITITYTPAGSLITINLYKFDETTLLATQSPTVRIETLNGSVTVYGACASQCVYLVDGTDEIRIAVQHGGGNVKVNGSNTLNFTVTADATISVITNVFSGTTLIFMYDDGNIQDPTNITITMGVNDTSATITTGFSSGILSLGDVGGGNTSNIMTHIQIFNSNRIPNVTATWNVTADNQAFSFRIKIFTLDFDFSLDTGEVVTPTSIIFTLGNQTAEITITSGFGSILIGNETLTPIALNYFEVNLIKNSTTLGITQAGTHLFRLRYFLVTIQALDQAGLAEGGGSNAFDFRITSANLTIITVAGNTDAQRTFGLTNGTIIVVVQENSITIYDATHLLDGTDLSVILNVTTTRFTRIIDNKYSFFSEANVTSSNHVRTGNQLTFDITPTTSISFRVEGMTDKPDRVLREDITLIEIVDWNFIDSGVTITGSLSGGYTILLASAEVPAGPIRDIGGGPRPGQNIPKPEVDGEEAIFNLEGPPGELPEGVLVPLSEIGAAPFTLQAAFQAITSQLEEEEVEELFINVGGSFLIFLSILLIIILLVRGVATRSSSEPNTARPGGAR